MNAEHSTTAAPFKTGTRQLSADYASAGVEHEPRELGHLTEVELTALLLKLAAAAANALAESDPHVVIGAPRGRYIVRPGLNRLRLYDAEDHTKAYLELPPESVPAFLSETTGNFAEAAEQLAPAGPSKRTRPAATTALLVASLTVLISSAYFTFRDTTYDAETDYLPVPAHQLDDLRRQISGTFTTGGGEKNREIVLRLDGTVTFLEHVPGAQFPERQDETYRLSLNHAKTPMVRTARLGVIEIKDATSILYADETYTRTP